MSHQPPIRQNWVFCWMLARLYAKPYNSRKDVVEVTEAIKGWRELATRLGDFQERDGYVVDNREQISVSLMAMAFHKLGIPAVSLNAFQVKMHSTSTYGNARFKKVESERILHELGYRKIVIRHLGFHG